MKGFNSLPAEIIEIIFQMAYENEDDGFLPLKYAHPRSRKAVTGRKLLVPLHISSWIRAVNLSNSAVWSSSAEMVLASHSKRKGNARLFHLLRFCADRSSALKRLDFNQLADDRSLWARNESIPRHHRSISYIYRASSSSRSLPEIPRAMQLFGVHFFWGARPHDPLLFIHRERLDPTLQRLVPCCLAEDS